VEVLDSRRISRSRQYGLYISRRYWPSGPVGILELAHSGIMATGDHRHSLTNPRQHFPTARKTRPLVSVLGACVNQRCRLASRPQSKEGDHRESETISVITPVISREGAVLEVIAITSLSATGGRFPSPAPTFCSHMRSSVPRSSSVDGRSAVAALRARFSVAHESS
jgi:hypothetical protein